MKPYSIHYFSIPKDFETQALNEDRIFVTDQYLALADGAGGTGIYCGEWAQFLLESLPATPIENFEAFQNWFIDLQEPYLAKIEPIAQTDAYKTKRFYTEGSAATLVVVWLDNETFHWLCYGDSQVFFINDTVKSYPFQTSHDFGGATYLLNCFQLPNEQVVQFGKTTSKNTELLITSDAIGKYLMQQMEQNINLNEIILNMRLLEETDTLTRQYLKSITDLETDDYSLIYLKLK